MWELIRQSARHRLQRLALLTLGAFLITGGLSVLVGRVQAMQTNVRAAVQQGWATRYDLLVRPKSVAPLAGSIAPTDLQGGRGGISLAQLAQIRSRSDVAIAAPITDALVLEVPVLLPRGDLPEGLYRAAWRLDGWQGAGPVQGDAFLWILPATKEGAPDGALAEAFKAAGIEPIPLGEATKIPLPVTIPVRLVAVDPQAEAALVGLDRALTSGRYLLPSDQAQFSPGRQLRPIYDLPALIRAPGPSDPGLQMEFTLQAVPVNLPEGTSWPALTEELLRGLAGQGGPRYLRSIVTPAPVLRWESGQGGLGAFLATALRTSQLEPRWLAEGKEAPTPPQYDLTNPDQHLPGLTPVPAGQQRWGALQGNGWRAAGVDNSLAPGLRLRPVGTYDPSLIERQSPLDPTAFLYRPAPLPAVRAGGAPLSPSDLPGALLQAAPPAIVPLEAISRFLPTNPIGAVRVKVAGADAGPAGIEAVLQAARGIEATTGLQVDVIRGAALRPVQIQFAPGQAGDTAYTAQWLAPGTFVEYTRELERGDLAVLLLVGVVGILFILATATVHVLLRAQELATLAATGWRRHHLLLLVGAEAALVSGGGGLVALILLHSRQALTALALALLLYIGGALIAAASIGLGRPGRIMRSAGVTPHPSLAHVDSIQGAAWAALRARRRNGLMLLAIALPTALLLVMTGLSLHLEDQLFVEVAGQQVMLQLRPLHWGALAGAFVLAAGTAADLIALSVLERRRELAILAAIGWRPTAVRRHVLWEGLLAGLAAGGAGVLMGSALLMWALGGLPQGFLARMPLVLAVPVVTGLLGALLPARWAARLQTAQEVKLP
jgi:hypothetical protein